MSLRLTYFPIAGRGEPIRIAAFLGGVDLEDVRVAGADFMALKKGGALPLGFLPILEGEGLPTIAQCVPILRYIVAVGNAGYLIPDDPVRALAVDSAIDTFNDTLSRAFTPSLRERDPDKKRALREAFEAGPLTQCMRYVEGLASQWDGPFLTGDQLSIADLYIGGSLRHYASGKVDYINAGFLDDFPRMKRLTQAYLQHPGVQAYYAQ